MKITSLTMLCAGLLLIGLESFTQTNEIAINISGIRSDKGNVILNVFENKDQYDLQKPLKQIVFNKKSLNAGKMSVEVDLPKGVYGITLIDDENRNGKIDKNLIGIPKEGFGFSDFFLEKMKKPSFDDFKVDLMSGHPINIRVKYM